jgi:hypothetical protein
MFVTPLTPNYISIKASDNNRQCLKNDSSSYTPSLKPEYQTHPDIDQTADTDERKDIP